MTVAEGITVAVSFSEKQQKNYADSMKLRDHKTTSSGIVTGKLYYDVSDITNAKMIKLLPKTIDGKGEFGIIIFNESDCWYSKGDIQYIDVTETFKNTDLPKKIIIHVIGFKEANNESNKLHKHKNLAFDKLKYIKRTGKNSGNYNRGVCRLNNI